MKKLIIILTFLMANSLAANIWQELPVPYEYIRSSDLFELNNSIITKDYYLRDIYFRTLKIAGITTILAAFLGFPTSYYISRSAKKYRGIFLVLAVFPLLTSPVVRSFSWMIILGKNGIINDILMALSLVDEPLNLLYTEFSVITGLLYLFLPLMILSLVGVMENIDGELIRAAESLVLPSLQLL